MIQHMAWSLADQSSFPDLENCKCSGEKIGAAQAAVKALKGCDFRFMYRDLSRIEAAVCGLTRRGREPSSLCQIARVRTLHNRGLVS